MTHIKFVTLAVQQQVRASLVGSVLTYRIGEETDSVEYEFDLCDVIAKFSQDHGVIAIGSKEGEAFVVETTAISIGLRGSPYVETNGLARRDTPMGVYRSFAGPGGFPVCYLLTPRKGCALDEVTVYWFFNQGVTDITVDGSPLIADGAPIMPELLAEWLPIALEGPDAVPADGSAGFTVRAPVGAEVHLEATAGTLSRARARDGDAVVLTALGLTPGATARIKAGYKFWPSKIERTVTVTEGGAQ